MRDLLKHDFNMPHFVNKPGIEGCPPNCPARKQAAAIVAAGGLCHQVSDCWCGCIHVFADDGSIAKCGCADV